jgi:hypothetical protein
MPSTLSMNCKALGFQSIDLQKWFNNFPFSSQSLNYSNRCDKISEATS